MAVEYGTTGVKIITVGGGIAGTLVGREQIYVAFGRGDPVAGNATVNSPEKIATRVDAADEFGAGTQLATGIQQALDNGAHFDYVYGVMPQETVVVGETITGSGNLGPNDPTPIVEDESLVTATSASVEVPVNFVYESPPPTPAEGVNIKPQTGEVTGASPTASYSVDYRYLDWEAALNSADDVIGPAEVGVYNPLSDAVAVAQQLQTKVNQIRYPQIKLVSAVMGAQPNKTGPNGEPQFDTASYTDTIDHDAVWLFAPGRASDGNTEIVGAVGGIFAGNALDNPVYGDPIRGGFTKLSQTFTETDVENLRARQVIPIQDYGGGEDTAPTLEDNLSTSTATDWKRDFFRRRIVDQVILVGNEIGRAARSQKLTPESMDGAKQNFLDALAELVREDLLVDNPEQTAVAGEAPEDPTETQKYFVDVAKTGPDAITLAVGFTPVGVTKTVTERLVVNDE